MEKGPYFILRLVSSIAQDASVLCHKWYFFYPFFDYFILTDSGRALVRKGKQEMSDCLSGIDYRSLSKPVLLMLSIYLLGTLTIIRADFLYIDDIGWSVSGYRGWYNWSRYVIQILSYIVQPEIQMTDISPMPQLLAVLILSCSSVLLVYVLCKGKLTPVRLLASIPLGLSPYFLECLSYKFMACYMAFSVLTSIVPFLFIARKKAFFFCSVAALLVMCMTYQAASGIYMLIVVILCFQDWNKGRKTNKEILSFLGTAALAFCFAMLIFKFFLMKSFDEEESGYVSTAIHPMSDIISGTLRNIKDYIISINSDLGVIWKTGIVLVLFFFITQSVYQSTQKKLLSFFVSILIVGLSCIVSYGAYFLLIKPLFAPRALLGFGVFLAVLCIYVVSDYKKPAIVTVLALNWCFFVFAFSYGNALADQKRYAEFRETMLFHDLNTLHLNQSTEDTPIQFAGLIDYAPSVKNIAKHNPVIEKLVPKGLGGIDYDPMWMLHFNFVKYEMINMPQITSIDFNTLDLPVVLDSYYHTIQSDGNYILVTLKH